MIELSEAPKPARAKEFSPTTPLLRPAKRLLRWLERILAVVGIFFIIYHLCFETAVMTSGSMAPALQGNSYADGDRMLIEKVTGLFRKPKRWKIYFFYNADGVPVAKRVVGLPGERISIRNNHVCINGAEISQPERLKSLKYYAYGSLSAGREVACGEGYFMLGDDSQDSYDSRFVGPVMRRDFRGRVWCILWPGNRFGFVH